MSKEENKNVTKKKKKKKNKQKEKVENYFDTPKEEKKEYLNNKIDASKPLKVRFENGEFVYEEVDEDTPEEVEKVEENPKTEVKEDKNNIEENLEKTRIMSLSELLEVKRIKYIFKNGIVIEDNTRQIKKEEEEKKQREQLRRQEEYERKRREEDRPYERPEPNKKLIIKTAIICISVFFAIMLFSKGVAVLTQKKYTITFDTDGGSTVETQKVKEREKVKNPGTPSKEGYKFIGWYYEGREYNFDFEIYKDITIKAEWELIPVIHVSSVSLDKEDITLRVDDVVKLDVSIKPDNADIKSIKWVSSNEQIVTIDSDGNITAKKEGTATIKAISNDNGKEAICNVLVKEKIINIEELSFDSTSDTIKLYETKTLNLIILPENASNKEIKWSSSEPNIVSVDKKGNIKGLRRGTSVIKAESKVGKLVSMIEITVE